MAYAYVCLMSCAYVNELYTICLQLQTFKFRGAWYDLNAEERVEAIKRVHDVAFSQVYMHDCTP
jgi:hypothetical protein